MDGRTSEAFPWLQRAVLADPSQHGARAMLTSLIVRAGRSQTAEELPALDVHRDDQLHHRVRPLADGGPRLDARPGHHPGGHVRCRMQRVDHDACSLEFFCEIERVHDLRELALSVGPSAAEVVLDHDVVKIDGSLRKGRDVHDA